ncbi:MAG: DUF5060 domain-containing protein [Nitrospirae bacterium]|nr:DUF5060 domain-containing protein [Candidatus Manganitrophaceae bacterium]
MKSLKYIFIFLFLITLSACGGNTDERAGSIESDDSELSNSEPPETSNNPPGTDPPLADPPVADPPVVDPPETDPPVVDPPVTDPEDHVQVLGEPPYAQSTILSRIDWNWDTHLSRGKGQNPAFGSDIWPMTWAADGNLYTTWGDGGGFGGNNTDGRVSLGLARIEGTPPNWKGVNVWGGKNPESTQTTVAGKGYIAAVDGALYIWGKKQGSWDSTRILKSTDNGLSWEVGGFILESPLHHFTPVQFGKDYQDSPDAYVYGYLGEGNDLFLARVLKTEIGLRTGYEVFSGLSPQSVPTWSENTDDRVSVFTDLNGRNWGYQSVYHPILKRYILTVTHGGDGEGSGLGIFDAPNLWGPWTVVEYTDEWKDAYNKFSFSFPQKWMSTDRLGFWMTHSGWPEYDGYFHIQGTFKLQNGVSVTFPNPTPESTEPIALYGVFEKSVSNTNSYVNPFDFNEIELQTRFIAPSGKETSFFGFYDGDGQGGQDGSIWKMRFMPDEIGSWNYSYTWSDGRPGGNGTFSVNTQGLPGPFKADVVNGKSWAREGKGNLVPLFIGTHYDMRDGDAPIEGYLDYVAYTLGANGVSHIFRNLVWLDCEEEASCSPSSDVFSIQYWTRFDQYLKKLSQRDLSLNVMIYTDDAKKPKFAGQSDTEKLLLKTVIARVAASTNIIFDSGIDIREYRSEAWSNWFAGEMMRLDPWDHFIGSRHGGGSGETSCSDCSYDARGEVHPNYVTLKSIMDENNRPVFSTERWREDFRRGGFNSENIRKIMWYNAMVGGSGFMIGGKKGSIDFNNYATDLDAPEQFKIFSDFWHLTVKNWSNFVVCNEDVSAAYCFAERGKSTVLYLENGGTTTLNLSAFSGSFPSQWLNPRTGETFDGETLSGGSTVTIQAPDAKDWVFYMP